MTVHLDRIAVHPYGIATLLLAGLLTLSAVGGIALTGSAYAAQSKRAELVQQSRANALRADASEGVARSSRFGSSSALQRVTPMDRSLARQDMFRNPLTWTADRSSVQWSATSVPNPESPNGVIQALSCPSAGHCEGVGSYQNTSGDQVMLAEVWNGAKWTTQSVPKPSGSISSYLGGISCTASDACVAVGGYESRNGNFFTFAELWTGAHWTLKLTPNPAGNQGAALTAVSCTSAACEAVGYYYNSSGDQLAIAELFSGTSWTIQTLPNPTATNGDQLNGVSCTATACEAVGFYGTGALNSAGYAEVFNGIEWSAQTIPEPSDSNDEGTGLQSVSCVPSGDCEAVGSYSNKTDFQLALAEVWNGIAWAVQPAVNPAASTGLDLNSVSCISMDACAAVGVEDYGELLDTAAVTEVWNGAGWALQSSADPDHSDFTALSAISCITGFCESAGDYVNSSGDQTVLAEGTTTSGWLAQKVPNEVGNFGDQLAAVSCVKRSACEAVGEFDANDSDLEDNAWAEKWSGSRWRLQTVPDPRGNSNSELKAISCRSASRCEAVGDYTNSAEDGLTLAELWNGHRWAVQRTPNPHGSLYSLLAGVSCSSKTNCEAVGEGGAINNFVIAEHWNGRKWDLQKTPKTRGDGADLRAVSCVTKTSCEAVGQYFHSLTSSVLLGERWNGHKWTLQRLRSPAGTHNAVLDGVSCTSADACEAVGTYEIGGGERPLAEAWNGHKWSIQRTVRPGSSGDFSVLDSISCASKHVCEATGFHFSELSANQYTLVEAWNGHKWRRQSSATPGGGLFSSGGFASPLGVSCVSKVCRLVGYYQTPSFADLALVETFRG